MTDYDAILFDNDGVLVEPPAPESLRAVCDHYGLNRSVAPTYEVTDLWGVAETASGGR